MDSLDEDSRRILAVVTGGFAALTVTLWSLRLAYALLNAPFAHLVSFLGLLFAICLGVGLGVLVDTPPKMKTGEPQGTVTLPKPLPDTEEEIGKAGDLTRIAQEQACQSYANITREVSAFFLATETLENEAANLSSVDRRDLHTARLAYLQHLEDSFREGQAIIRRYLRGA